MRNSAWVLTRPDAFTHTQTRTRTRTCAHMHAHTHVHTPHKTSKRTVRGDTRDVACASQPPACDLLRTTDPPPHPRGAQVFKATPQLSPPSGAVFSSQTRGRGLAYSCPTPSGHQLLHPLLSGPGDLTVRPRSRAPAARGEERRVPSPSPASSARTASTG